MYFCRNQSPTESQSAQLSLNSLTFARLGKWQSVCSNWQVMSSNVKFLMPYSRIVLFYRLSRISSVISCVISIVLISCSTFVTFIWEITGNLSLCYIPFVLKLFARFSTRLLRARWRGPSAKKYLSVIWPPAARFPRPLEGHFCTHWESGSVALHTVTWQWTNTNGWPAINLKASRLNRWALTDGAEWYCTVTSLGHLKDRFEENKMSSFWRR